MAGTRGATRYLFSLKWVVSSERTGKSLLCEYFLPPCPHMKSANYVAQFSAFNGHHSHFVAAAHGKIGLHWFSMPSSNKRRIQINAAPSSCIKRTGGNIDTLSCMKKLNAAAFSRVHVANYTVNGPLSTSIGTLSLDGSEQGDSPPLSGTVRYHSW